jgi:NADPH2:quinone reductase
VKSIVYTRTGPADVLHLTDRPVPDVGSGQVRVKVVVSGVNPTDWKSRQGSGDGADLGETRVPNQDGAGVVDAVGDGVDTLRVSDRV